MAAARAEATEGRSSAKRWSKAFKLYIQKES